MDTRIAYAFIPQFKPGERIVFITYREDGYTQTTFDHVGMSEADCQQIVNNLNAQIGVPPNVADSMIAASMYGWHIPGAEAAIVHFSLLGDAPLIPNNAEESHD